jgi:lipoprotein-anchoring transpeptidase ErfK/SrfK
MVASGAVRVGSTGPGHSEATVPIPDPTASIATASTATAHPAKATTSRRRHARRSRWLLLVLLVPALLGVASCASSGAGPAAPASGRSAVDLKETAVARPTTDTEVFLAPDAAEPDQVLPARTEFGSPLALMVVDDRVPGWLEVLLPTRPNQSAGWIRADGVEVRRTTMAVRVDLATRRLVVSDAGAVVLETPVAVGAPGTPTPTGTFFVVDELATGSASSSYGPFAFGLSAHSEVLTEFAGGDGQVGIHGTNDPSSIGNPVSNGCVRVPNEVAVRLNELLVLGTPVVVA